MAIGRRAVAARGSATPALTLVAALLAADLPTLAADPAAVFAETGSVVFEGRSASGIILVRDRSDGVRELRFGRGGAVQTAILADRPEALVLPYSRLVMSSLAVVPDPGRILMIGLGGGAMARFLRLAYPGASVDAVEIDPAVVEVARRYFELPEHPLLRVHVADGRAFVEGSRERWDLVILDAYGAGGVPAALGTREFLAAVRARTAPGGVVAANLWSGSGNPLYGSMLATFLDVFEQVLVVSGAGTTNRVVLALPTAIEDPATALVARAGSLGSPPVAALDLAGVLRAGLEAHPEPPPGARVLTDAEPGG